MTQQFNYKDEFLYLTTIGWKSGTPHEIEIWYTPHSGCFYLISGGRDTAHWVKNILNNPRVSFRVQGQHYNGAARIIDHTTEPELAEIVAGLMRTKYNWSDGWIVELRSE